MSKILTELRESWERGLTRCRRKNTLSPLLTRLDTDVAWRRFSKSVPEATRKEFDALYPGALGLALQRGEDDFFDFTDNAQAYLMLMWSSGARRYKRGRRKSSPRDEVDWSGIGRRNSKDSPMRAYQVSYRSAS